jgi:hypothetical protein
MRSWRLRAHGGPCSADRTLAWEAFVDFRLNAMALNGWEITSIAPRLGNDVIDAILSKREADELEAKL